MTIERSCVRLCEIYVSVYACVRVFVCAYICVRGTVTKF